MENGVPETEEWILNPSIQLKVEFTAAIKGREKIRASVSAEKSPEFIRLLLAAASERCWTPELKRMAWPYLRELQELGVLIPTSGVPRQFRFEEAFHSWDAIKAEMPSLATISLGPWRINNSVQVSTGALPEGLGSFVPDPLVFQHQRGGWAWVGNRDAGRIFPYWLNDRQVGLVRGLLAGEMQSTSLSADDQEYFVHAEILLLGTGREATSEEGKIALSEGRASLRDHGLAVARGLFRPLQLAVLRIHFRKLKEEGFFELDRVQAIESRSFIHNDPLASFIQGQMLAWVEAIAGENIKPSYSFLTSYFPGAELKRHTDREQCAWNVSLMIDAQPDTALEESWPLCFDVRGKVREARLLPGDAVLYRGVELPHWRPPLPAGHTATVLLGHYVAADFAGSLL